MSDKHLKVADLKWPFTSFNMPSIWYKEEEIYNLMQSFKRPRHIDPSSYDLKINFWSNLILKYCLHHHILVINESELQAIFTKEFQSSGMISKPLCLGIVLKHMVDDGKLQEASKFTYSGNLAIKMISGLIWSLTAPIAWGYSKISLSMSSDIEVECDEVRSLGDLVVLDALRTGHNEFIKWIAECDKHHISPQLNVMTTSDFDKFLSCYYPHEASRNVARQSLISNRFIEILTLPSSSNQVVRFTITTEKPLSIANSKNPSVDRQTLEQINAIVNLRSVAARLGADEIEIAIKLDSIKERVRNSLLTGRKEEAKNHLKRGKVVEKILERKRAQLQNVETMLLEIESSSDNMQVVKALSHAASALKAQAMDINIVHDTMAEIGDALADQDEINASISAISDSANRDLQDLEQELVDLLVDNHLDPSPRKESPLPDLPEVPSHSISPNKTYWNPQTVKLS